MTLQGFAREGARFERNSEFVFRQIVDEAVLIPIRQQLADMDCIYTLNDVGALVWRKLEQPAARAEILQAILDEYETDAETAALDLSSFLLRLVDIGAVHYAAPTRTTGPVQEV